MDTVSCRESRSNPPVIPDLPAYLGAVAKSATIDARGRIIIAGSELGINDEPVAVTVLPAGLASFGPRGRPHSG